MCTYRVFLHIFAVLLMCDGMFSTPAPPSAERTTIEISSTSDSAESATFGNGTELNPDEYDGANTSHEDASDQGIPVTESDTKSTKVTPSTARPMIAELNPCLWRNEDILLIFIPFVSLIVLLFGILYLLVNIIRIERMYLSLYSHLHTNNWNENQIYSDVDVDSLCSALAQLQKTHETLSQTGLRWAQTFAVDVTLDPDTATPYLILSDNGKQVSYRNIKRNVPENPKRFEVDCVLAKQGFSSGRFYYEVQVKGKTDWGLGVVRESINRKGRIWMRPDNGVWTVVLRNENQYLACENTPVSLSLWRKPEKVGVFVDYEEGLVSFYDVESRSHLHSFTGQTFTEKLYPFFDLGPNYNGKNSNPLIITNENKSKHKI